MYLGIKSYNFNHDLLLKEMIELHGNGQIDYDPTFSKGNFYKNIKKPKFYSDFSIGNPLFFSDMCNMPFKRNTFKSIMIDPPFLWSSGKSLKVIKKNCNIIISRFTLFKNKKKLLYFYKLAIGEAYRVLKKDGVLFFKCQDVVNGSLNNFIHIDVFNIAVSRGFIAKDLFLFLKENRLKSGKWKKQNFARKHHSYFWVFHKRGN